MSTQLVLPRRTLWLSLVLIIVITIAAVAYTRLPRAVITIQPATHERSVEQNITLSAATKEPDFVRYVLPAVVKEKEIVETQTITRTGATTFDDFAKGKVKMINQQGEEQRLLPKTHLRHETSGVFFLTDNAVTIPPKSEIEVGITAEAKGPAGNVAAGKFIIDKLPAAAQSVVYAQSSTPTGGGVSVDAPLTEDELNQAKDTLRKKVADRALAELTTAAGGAALRPELITQETLEESSSAEVGSRATEFTLASKVKARAFVVDDNDLLSLTLLALRSSPSADEEFLSYAPDSFKVQILKSDFTRGEARIRGTLTGSFASKTGATVFSADNLAGRTEAEVQEYFKQYPSVSNVTVAFSPFWVTTVPARPAAVEIIVKNEGK